MASREVGLSVGEVVISGGAGASPLVRRVLADAAAIPVAVPRSPEPVLLGAAMLGAIASGVRADAGEAMRAMSGTGGLQSPDPASAARHERAYRRFLALQAAAVA